MFFTLSLALAVTPIGLTTIPDQPEKIAPTWTHQSAQQQLIAGTLKPRNLIPVNYKRHGQVRLYSKHYDEKQQVYRFSEVVDLLKTREASRVCLVDYEKHLSTGQIWLGVACGTVFIFPLNLLFEIPAVTHLRQARDSFTAALVAYNQRK